MDDNKPNRKCVNCGKITTPYTNYCDWECSIERAKKNGGVVHTPNGLPITCITRDNLMVECEGGDHPDYQFPVEVEYLGDQFESEEFELALYGRVLKDDEERRRCMAETHALIYTDGSIAITVYECTYAMWHLDKGAIVGGRFREKLSGYKAGQFHHGDCKLSETSRLKIINSVKPQEEVQVVPTPVVTHCPSCKKQHLDENEWLTRAHRWHRCVDDSAGKGCGHEWKITDVEGPTVGVAMPEHPTESR